VTDTVRTGSAYGVGIAAGGVARLGAWLQAVAKGFVGAAAVALAYQLVHWSGIVDPRVLPSVTVVLAEMARLLVSTEFHIAVLETLWPALVGLFGASLVGIPAGLLIGISPLAERISRSLIDVMRSLPGTALIPVFMVTIGADHR
jgi:ABC-type nitrate/sulfonate/bicarbonate transport system permease component